MKNDKEIKIVIPNLIIYFDFNGQIIIIYNENNWVYYFNKQGMQILNPTVTNSSLIFMKVTEKC